MAMNEMSQTQHHDEVDLLLPWYVNDTLDPAEHDRVANHVAACAECQESVALLTDVQAAVVRNKATPIVPQPRVDELLDSIDSNRSPSLPDRQQLMSFMAAAAVTLLLVATLVITNPDDNTDTAQVYETATSTQDGASMDYVLRIQFTSGISQKERDQVLQDIGARDISGSIDEGSYRVIVHLPAASLEELDGYTGSLESLPEVSSVSVVALQLPVNKE
jgi:hypothetical protein